MAIPKAPTTGSAKKRTAPSQGRAQKLGITKKATPLLKAVKSGPSRSNVGPQRIVPKSIAKLGVKNGGKKPTSKAPVKKALTAPNQGRVGKVLSNKGSFGNNYKAMKSGRKS